MKNSIIIFALGATTGVSATLLTNSNTQLTTNSAISDPVAIEQQLATIEQAVTELNDTSSELHTLVEKYSYLIPKTLLDKQDSALTNQQPQMNNQSNEMHTENAFEQFLTQLERNQDGMMMEPSSAMQQEEVSPAPTKEQVERYHSIENRLFAASNNREANLSALVADATKLTTAQRNELTRKAYQMIQNGTLTTEQFKP